jgi:hypothetical protein
MIRQPAAVLVRGWTTIPRLGTRTAVALTSHVPASRSSSGRPAV